MKRVKQMEYSISVATIHRIQHGKDAIRENIRKTGKKMEYFQKPMLRWFERSEM